MKRFKTFVEQMAGSKCSCCGNMIDKEGKCGCGSDCPHCGGQHNMNEDVRKMSHGRLKFHMNNKSVPHGSFSFDQMKSERDRRLKTGQGAEYKKAKSSISEEAEHDLKK